MSLSLDVQQAKTLARLGGLLYLAIILLGGIGELRIRGNIVVAGDPTATATNLISMEGLWRFGVAAEAVLLVCGIGLGLVLYALLSPVNRPLAVTALFLNLVTIAVEAVAAVALAAALLPLTTVYAGNFTSGEAAGLAMLFVRLHTNAFGFALVFFGLACVILGYLIQRSRYMPAPIGALMVLSGVCYVVNSLAAIVAPAISNLLLPFILIPPLIGELSLALWLLLVGVREDRWEKATTNSVVVSLP
jgi:hypothetical protein